MSGTTARRKLLNEPLTNGKMNGSYEFTPPSELFGQNVFGLSAMRQVLPKQVYKHMVEIHEKGTPLDPATADVVASAMKDWAMSRGATHYCHWFHPLTGLTAEKHSSFMTPTGDGGVITEFTGANLMQGEPDASSFPSGGIRSTFEARGYTGWDPTSNAFIIEGRNGKTLCIPSVFLGFGGHALDEKTPLLRSVDAISKQAMRILKLFGTQATRCITYLGPEQEYFLIDRKYYALRPDLMTAGRTLFGARPSKGQEMEDHYFGHIKERVLAYMVDMEQELYKLGIPVTTRHNEVAPNQFELAPMHERANIATDHNMLTMSVMERVAAKHNMVCLLAEKPFAGVNGSGKHNNWSIADNLGTNLLDPGHTPHENAQFLVFLTAVLRALHEHGDLLRASIATPANDHRLGANEAPPAILSTYLGDKLAEVVNALIEGSEAKSKPNGYINIGVASLPPLPMHDSDRNRTSPFAFTGNKFEFRAVGSGQSIARPNTVLNTIVADSLSHIADEIETELKDKKVLNDAVRSVVQKNLKAHQAIIFNGDNYSDAWQVEAAKRGLPNNKNFVTAIPAFVTDKARKIFSEHAVLSKEELDSRYHIWLENFIKTINIEAALTSNIARTQILPVCIEYQTRVAASIAATKSVLKSAKFTEQEDLLEKINEGINRLIDTLDALDSHRSKDDHEHDLSNRAKFFQEQIRPSMDNARAAADSLELICDDSLWPLPKYRELLSLS